MTLMTNERTLMAIECPACGAYTEKPLPWLKVAEFLDCSSCGNNVDISFGDQRVEIDRMFERTVRFGALEESSA
jgi:hypothetical protein